MPKAGFEFALNDGVLEFRDSTQPLISTCVRGTIINSITEQKERLQTWKRTVASAIRRERGGATWNPDHFYAITLEFRFHPANHGNQTLDVENDVKPVVDAVAAGLFMAAEEDPSAIRLWNFPDSNFRTLLIHRAADPPSAEQEGICVFVSVRQR